jgi:hypothetical protein
MNWHAIGQLVRLRHQLLWAKTRSRAGRIALLAVGVLLSVLLSALLSAGGVGAGVLAIQSGNAAHVAQTVLSGLFLSTVFGTIVAGFGIDAAFSDLELRRYPLKSLERCTARHFLGVADPYWCLVLALETGLVAGLHAYGSFSLWNGGVGAILLLLCAYLLTHVLSAWINRIMTMGSRYLVVFLLMMAGGFVPAAVVALFQNHRVLLAKILPVLQFTPPFGAAAVMTHRGSDLLQGLAVLACWLFVLLALLVTLERHPAPRVQAPRESRSLWDGPIDRIAAIFDSGMAPLVSYWLRLYLRNNRFRLLAGVSLPIAAFLSLGIGQPRQPGGSLFVGVLGCSAIVTFLATSRISVNQYGYAGAGLRRLYLLPTDLGASLRAGSIVALMLGAAWIPPAALLWTVFAPRPLDPRVLLMPVMNAVTALFLFQGLCLWTSTYAPRRANYGKVFGNDMTPLGNVAFPGTMFGSMLLPSLLRTVVPQAIAPERWWLTLPPAGFAPVFYLLSLRLVGHPEAGRREALLAVIEGRN